MSETLRSDSFRLLWRGLDGVLLFCSAAAVVLLVAEIGFGVSGWRLEQVTAVLLGLFVGQELVRVVLVANPWRYARRRWLELGVALGVAILLFSRWVLRGRLGQLVPELGMERIVLLYLVVAQGLILGGVLVRAVRYHTLLGAIELHPGALLLGSFLGLSLLGTGALMMPAATVEPISVVDAVFTAVSAVCVTGLTVVDTATRFTPMGQLILLLLIQLGGLGLMTFMSFFGMLFTAGLGVRERLLLGEIFAVESLAEVRRLLVRVIAITVSVEALGACVLYWSDGGGLPLDSERAFRAVFHAVSAFCNAGFSLYSENLVAQQHNVLYLGTVMVLVVCGGLGFPVLSALLALRPWGKQTRRLQSRLPVSARLVLVTTAILLVGGTVLLWALEHDGVFASFAPWERWFQAMFLAVVPRTAGFNSVPIGELSEPAALVVIALMWIGASPASTGGGVKTLTVAVAVLGMIQLLRGQPYVRVYHREIPLESVVKAFIAVVVSAAFLLVAAFVVHLFEPRASWLDVLFETASALGTVGLSRGITAELSDVSKLLLCVVMLVGRVGVLTVFSMLIPLRRAEEYRYLQERLIIA